MISESIQVTLINMRLALERNNGDYEELAPFFLDSLEADMERVAGLEAAAVCVDASYTAPAPSLKARQGVLNG